MSKRIKDYDFVAWQVIIKEELVLRLDLVTLMVIKKISIIYCMASQRVSQRMGGGNSSYTHIDL